MVAIILVSLTVVALVALLIIRKRKNNLGQKPAAAQNSARDPAEALKLDADGSVLQEVMASMSHTPNSTASGNGTYDYETADGNASVEVEPYSDNPKRNSNGIPRTHTNGSYGPSIL
jgi:predicted lipid-binding transport protein (Tim44 family)